MSAVHPIHLPSAHPIIDQFGNPATLEGEPWEFVPAQKPPLEPMLLQTFHDYIAERARPKGCYVPRVARSMSNLCLFYGPDHHPNGFKQAEHRAYTAHRLSQGVAAPTVRRELAVMSAAINFDHMEDRLPQGVKIQKPSGTVIKERRAATEAEYQLLMRKGVMSWRIRMFFRLAYWTGHRSEAIQQLTFDRIDWESRTLNFNLPGHTITNKRRNGAFPIPDGLMPFLLAAKARHDMLGLKDNYVIGVGKRGKPSCTYDECKAAWRSVGVDVEGLARHCFRKTFVTELVKAGEKLETAAVLIADRPETAGRHYFKLVQQDLRTAVNRRAA